MAIISNIGECRKSKIDVTSLGKLFKDVIMLFLVKVNTKLWFAYDILVVFLDNSINSLMHDIQ